jgi:hypothetical protein
MGLLGIERQTVRSDIVSWRANPLWALDRPHFPAEIGEETKIVNIVAFMKKMLSSRFVLLAGATSWFLASVSLGADTNSTATVGATAPAAAGAPAAAPQKLPYGVEDVLKLSRAQIGEDVILNYIQNTGTIYNLSPTDIVYLRNSGVSDRVLNAMLDQRKRVEAAAQPAPLAVPSVPSAPALPNANTVPTPPTYVAPAPAYSYTYVQPSAPASSLYIIPYPTPPRPAYYDYYGYYSPYLYYGPYHYRYYGGYRGPALSFGFSFGGGGHHH